MNLSPFSDAPFDDADAFADFQLVHGLAHERIAEVMYENSLFYITYPLMDNPQQDTDWLLNHQSEHESIFSRLNMTGLPDLATVDLSKEDEYFDWQNLHREIHERINKTLGIA